MKNSRVRNQRVSSTRQRRQTHLLEVTPRHDVAVSQRNRSIVAFLFKVVLVVAVGAGAWFGGKEGLRRFFWENSDYYLSDVRVFNNSAMTREQILNAGGVVLGTHILKVDLTRARVGIEALPQTERVEIQRTLPNRLSITITERRPLAWVTAKPDSNPAASEKAFLIDARGFVMRSKTVLPEYLLLPVISGVEIENLVAGQRVLSLEMQAALDLVRLNADSTRFQARNIDISKGYCLKVTSRTKSEMTFGLDRVDLQLERLNRLLDFLEPTKREIQTVNLLVERNMPVTFTDSPLIESEEHASDLPPSPAVAAPLKGTGAAKATPARGTRAVAPKATPAKAIPARSTPVKSTPAVVKASATPSANSVRPHPNVMAAAAPKVMPISTPLPEKKPALGFMRQPAHANGW